MLKKTITYKDYNGEEQTEDYYFNLTEAECMELELRSPGGFKNMIMAAVNAKDTNTLVDIVKDFISRSCGQKSPDGRKFYKSPAITAEFMASPAASILFVELATDAEATAAFVNAVCPNGPEGKKVQST